ncbi:hypothetical protein CIPAW_03G049900 [Carya illinoinensis]|uniref:Uncharacterized protein n=1 Tax=Carya illinoinensis TaxID=32201 RepID=A0A8T1QZF8_CARIL|nr:hypothetical protein CIPAW_03G049900 [Carya illinoinensis]
MPAPAPAPPPSGHQPDPPKPKANNLNNEAHKPKNKKTKQDRNEKLGAVSTATPLSDLHPCERLHPRSAHPQCTFESLPKKPSSVFLGRNRAPCTSVCIVPSSVLLG